MSDAPAKRVILVELTAPVIAALGRGDLSAANAGASVTLTEDFVSPEAQRTWRIRSTQLEIDPSAAEWITRAVIDASTSDAVGQAGFHGPPNKVGMVEVGYRIGPSHRRQGYARATLEAMLGRAAADRGVRTVRATISPDNEASRSLVVQYGFLEVGEQWDDDDGLETIFERAVR